MIADKIYSEQPIAVTFKSKLRDYKQLIKLRLNTVVVFSTVIGFLIGSTTGHINWLNLLIVTIGGFLTVGAANGINQIIEKDSDKLMKRTENRPVAQNRMSVNEAGIASFVMGFVGLLLITLFLNKFSGILSLSALCIYAFIYTPLKKISPIAVHVGAISGAIPPIIGYVAATGRIDAITWALFIIQFIWQFPHFYAIAWVCDDDYKRAGLRMLPLGADKDKKGAWQILLFTLSLLPLSFLPYFMGNTSIFACVLVLLCSGLFSYQSIALFRELSDKRARQLMFGSFLYLPLVFIIILMDKLI